MSLYDLKGKQDMDDRLYELYDSPIRVTHHSDGSIEATYEKPELYGYSARVVLDSVPELGALGEGNRLVTMVARFPRSILSEFNTHRAFCLSGDAHLSFTRDGQDVVIMSVSQFVREWEKGDSGIRTMEIKQFNEDKHKVHYAAVVGVQRSGVKQVYAIHTTKGHSVKASADHLFYTENGWKKLREITVGEKVWVESGYDDQKGAELARVSKIVLSGEQETFDLEVSGKYANFFANGFVVHNSRNSASSRARSVKSVIQSVMENPYIPHFTKNMPGMSGVGLSASEQAEACKHWEAARDNAVLSVLTLLVGDLSKYGSRDEQVSQWSKIVDDYYENIYRKTGEDAGGALNIHKQDVNRLLEPFMWHEVIVSSTYWQNFFELRLNRETAHPSIVLLAQLMYEVMRVSDPVVRSVHIPFVAEDVIPDFLSGSRLKIHSDSIDDVFDVLMLSAAQAARVSYKDTAVGVKDDNTALGRRLLAQRHLSPFEHAAILSSRLVDIYRPGNFGVTWASARSILES